MSLFKPGALKVVLFILALAVAFGFGASPVDAQEETPAEAVPAELGQTDVTSSGLGSADFRTAPIVENETYSDTAVSGDTVWYAFQLSGGERHVKISAVIEAEELAEDLRTRVELFGPDLARVATSDAEGRISQVVSFGQFESESPATWYVSVRVDGPGDDLLGTALPFKLSLEGADSANVEPCGPDNACPSESEVGLLLGEVQKAEAAFDDRPKAAARPELNPEDRLALLEERRQLVSGIDLRQPEPPTWPRLAYAGATFLGLAVGAGGVTLRARRNGQLKRRSSSSSSLSSLLKPLRALVNR